ACISSFGKPVGINKETIARSQSKTVRGKLRGRKHAKRDSSGFQGIGSVFVKMQDGKMPGVDKLDSSIVRSAANHKRCELSRECAFKEYSVGCLHHAGEGKISISEASGCCIEMTHEHGGGNALTGNIPAQKEKIAICCKVIAIVAAHNSCRLIVVDEFPAFCDGVFRWKQPSLNPGGQS